MLYEYETCRLIDSWVIYDGVPVTWFYRMTADHKMGTMYKEVIVVYYKILSQH